MHLDLLSVRPLRSGLVGLFTQNLILMGTFFVVPLYLQLVLGLDALQTGLRMLPISITMFLAAALGSRLSSRFSIRTIVRAGLASVSLGVLLLLGVVDPTLNGTGFAVAMAVLGVGMGLIASQLGNVVQSSVDASGRSEAGGLQFTSQQLGSSLGIALIGAVVLTSLTSVFISTVQQDERISAEVSQQVGIAVGGGIDFASSDQIGAAAQDAGLDADTSEALVQNYETAQLQSLRLGLLVAALLVLIGVPSTAHLPRTLKSSKDTDSEDPPPQ